MLTNRRLKKFFLNVAGIFILVVAIVLRVSQLYLMAAILLLIPLVSYVFGRVLMIGVSCERHLPTSCSEGERVVVTLQVNNIGLLPKFLLRVRDRLPRWLEHAGPETPPILQLLPGEAETVTYMLEPRQRGVYPFGAVQIVSTDPLGFYEFTQDVPAAGELIVYPSVLPLSHVTLEGGGGLGPREREGALARGGTDFDGVREWRPGDELRRVHWRTTARTGKLAVVEYMQGTASDMTLALDLNAQTYAGTGEGPEGALETAVRMAASLAVGFLREGWTVRFLSAQGGDMPLLLTEMAQGPRLLEALARAQADASRTLADVLNAAQAAGGGNGRLHYITPDAHSPALAAALAAWGGRVQGWWIDRESFLTAPASRKSRNSHSRENQSVFAPTPLAPENTLRVVRRGDDVAAVLEGEAMRDGSQEKAVGPPSAGRDTLSLPLYVGGLGVTLCGVQAVSSSMNISEITTAATLLTLLGFGFSLACRRLRVQPRVIEIVCLVLIMASIYLSASHQLDLSWFLSGADKTEDRIAAVLMWSAVLWSWTLISDDNVMFSCVLSAAMIGLTGTSNVNTPIIVFFCLFMLAMLFLLIHHNYLQSRAALPTPRRGSVSPRALLGMQGALAALCALGVLGLAAVVVVPAQAMLANLSLAQAVRQLVNTGKVDNATPVVATQFFDDVSLNVGRGSVWPTGTDTVMRVSASDGQPHYWRGRTYDVYSGDGWQSSLSVPEPLKAVASGDRRKRFPILGSAFSDAYAPALVGETSVPSGVTLAPRAPLLQAIIEVRGMTNEFYYCDQPRDLWFDTGGLGQPRLSPDGCLDLEDAPVHSAYKIVCDPAPDINDFAVQKRLRHAGTQYPQAVRRLYLGVLSEADNSITTTADVLFYQGLLREIFAALPPARRTPLDKAVAIRDWVASNCTYSLSVAPLPDDVDHVRAFLDGTRTGYCDLFASAVVVLCRTAGIPARVATGFAPGEQDGTVFNLRSMDKHAWAEVYFPGSSWLTLDATVGSRADASVPTGHTENIGWTRRLWSSLTQSGPVPVVLLLAIMGLLVWIAKNELWDKRVRRPAKAAVDRTAQRARNAVGQQWMDMTRELGRLGLPRRPSETPAEFAARARAFFGEQQAVTGVALPFGAIDTLTGQFTLSRYAPAAGSESTSAASAALSEVSAAARRARRALLWHRLRHAFKSR